ncbi:uncharacterized protein LOC135217182 [Macrobrachium nipponense]|uniref:uncharacterized protein LOC135217182 n=1 Tax=Macrobrachium nipponense TaxID=159736 RepID=UPI0030C8CB86
MKFSGITSIESSWSLVLQLLVVFHAWSLVKCIKTKETALVTDVGRGVNDVPRWLAENDLGTSVAKKRARRFVPFPSGSKVTVTSTLTVPLEAISSSSDMEMVNTLVFLLPTSSTVSGRNYKSSKGERQHIYSQMENFLNDMGYNGHACTLRTLCEIAETPFEQGLYGDIINLILSASVKPEPNAVYDEYMTAEYYGQNYGNCAAIYTSCPNSVLDVMSNAF